MKNFVIFISAALLLSSCAAGYNSINVKSLNYTKSIQDSSGYSTAYKYDILSKAGNKRYAKKEDKRNISLVAVKFTNNSTEPVLGKDLVFYSGGNQFTPVDQETIYKKFKQGVVLYILYAPVILTKTECSGYGCQTKMLFPIGLPLAGLNMIMAASANSTFKKDLINHDLTKKVIKPGETVEGIIGIKNANYGVIKITSTPN